MRTATMAEWTAMIDRLRQRGAPADLVAKLASGAIGTFHTETGEMLTAPLEVMVGGAGVATAPAATHAKSYGAMTNDEKHALATSDPARFKRVRAEWFSWRGLTYAQLTNEQSAELYRTDRERWVRLRDAFLTETNGG